MNRATCAAASNISGSGAANECSGRAVMNLPSRSFVLSARFLFGLSLDTNGEFRQEARERLSFLCPQAR
jgi:hypothetical protein